MTLRVVQVNCAIDRLDREPDELLKAWPTLPDVAEATAKAGVEVTVVQAAYRAARFDRRGVAYQFVAVPDGGSGVISARRLAQVVDKQAPDVVHLNGLDFPVHARVLSGLDAPLLVQDHASRANLLRLSWLRRWGLARVSASAFAARAQAEPFLSTAQLPASAPVFTVPESSSWFSPGSRTQARRRTGVSGDPAVLWVGHLSVRKDPLTFLRAAASALDRLPDMTLWLVFGDGDLLAEVEMFLAQHPKLHARTHLLGRLPHDAIEDLCRACDLFVSASRSEGSGYALIEAMACGLPPVVSDIPSFREMAGDRGVGALFPLGDHQALAHEIVRLTHLPKAPLRRRVRDHFDATMSFDVVGARLVEAYASLAHGYCR